MQYPYARTQGKGLHGYKGTCSHACMHASCARRAFFAPPHLHQANHSITRLGGCGTARIPPAHPTLSFRISRAQLTNTGQPAQISLSSHRWLVRF